MTAEAKKFALLVNVMEDPQTKQQAGDPFLVTSSELPQADRSQADQGPDRSATGSVGEGEEETTWTQLEEQVIKLFPEELSPEQRQQLAQLIVANIIEDPCSNSRTERNRLIHDAEEGKAWEESFQTREIEERISVLMQRLREWPQLTATDLAVLFFIHTLDICREHIYFARLLQKTNGVEYHSQSLQLALAKSQLTVELVCEKLITCGFDVRLGKDINRLRNELVHDRGDKFRNSRNRKPPTNTKTKNKIKAEINDLTLDVATFEEATSKVRKILERETVPDVEQKMATAIRNVRNKGGITNLGQLLHILHSEYFKQRIFCESQVLGQSIRRKIDRGKQVLQAVPELVNLLEVLLKVSSGQITLKVKTRLCRFSLKEIPDIGHIYCLMKPLLEDFLLLSTTAQIGALSLQDG